MEILMILSLKFPILAILIRKITKSVVLVAKTSAKLEKISNINIYSLGPQIDHPATLCVAANPSLDADLVMPMRHFS